MVFSALFPGYNYGNASNASKTEGHSIYSFLFIHSSLVFGLKKKKKKSELHMIEMKLTS